MLLASCINIFILLQCLVALLVVFVIQGARKLLVEEAAVVGDAEKGARQLLNDAV
jgi:hypothetical protein